MTIDTDLAMDLRRKGLSWRAVATEVGATIYFLKQALRRDGVRYWGRYKEGPPLLTPHKLKKMKRLKDAGATWKELARISGIDATKLERYVRSH